MKNTIRKSQRGQRFTADYLDYDKVSLKANELLWDGKPTLGFYLHFSINTGLRVSDVLHMKHSQLAELKPGDYLNLTEKKTKKFKQVQINGKILEAYTYLSNKLQDQGKYDPEGFIFTSQKGSVFATESLNVILKKVFAGYAPNISTHSLRKSFGRHVYEKNGKSEDSLIMLSELFQHSSMAITRRYLGIRKEQLGSLYMNL